jgi:hypothetical protein
MAGETFRTEVLHPLMALVEWTKEDQQTAEKEALEFCEDSKGKTLQEKSQLASDKIAKKWKLGAAGFGIAGVAGAAILLLKKNHESKK